MRSFRGTGVALVTPFDRENRVDELSLRDLVDHVIRGGVDFLTVLGTTAEAATLSGLERERVVDVIVEQNAGRVPVMAGLGGNNTAEVLYQLEHTPWLTKCDCILSITPYYNKPSQRGLYEHFKAVGERSPLPVFLYNVPGRTGINMTAETTARLSADCPNIIGIKEASGNFEQATDIMNLKRPDFVVISGDDAIVLPLMSIGLEGVISVMANAYPEACHTMVDCVKNGDYATARQIHLRFAGLCKALFAEGNPAGIKAVLHARGIIRHNNLRLPLTPVSEGLYQSIGRQLAELD